MPTSKRYPGDIFSSLVPKDISKYARIGEIESVNGESGLCNIKWYDKPSGQRDVYITQPTAGFTSIPQVGDVVLTVMDQYNRTFILGYINLGHSNQVKKLNTLPKFKEGEKLLEAGGSYIYQKRNGNIVLSTLLGGIVEFDNTVQTWKYEVVNWKLVTEGGTNYFGLVKRLVTNTDGTKTVSTVSDLLGNLYTEYGLTLYETADGTTGINPSQTPILEITLGTVIDKDGNLINTKNVATLNTNKQLVARMKLKSGVIIDIDKSGTASISGLKAIINNASMDSTDTDISEGLQVNDSTLGTKGQHAAREHDKVAIPISSSYNDAEHKGLTDIGISNITALQTIAQAIVSPSGPCTLNPALLTGNLNLEGEITEGATNIYLGDS
jgi:hypothetical protein